MIFLFELLIHRGFSGYQTRWALEMFDEIVLKNSPDLVVLFFGANDAVVPGVLQHVPLEKYRENLMNMIDTLKKVQLSLILVQNVISVNSDSDD